MRTLSQAPGKELAMARITDGQVKRLWRFLDGRQPLSAAATKTGMDRKTARRYRNMRELPSDREQPRDWRTRSDPFDGVWDEVAAHLEREPALQPKTLFEWLQEKYPGRFEAGQVRTLQRRVRQWRATSGPAKEIFFTQQHLPRPLWSSHVTA